MIKSTRVKILSEYLGPAFSFSSLDYAGFRDLYSIYIALVLITKNIRGILLLTNLSFDMPGTSNRTLFINKSCSAKPFLKIF